MSLVETESIVLKRYNLAESDKIVVFLSKDFGIVRGVAKGVKRTNSKFGSSLELFSIVNLTYFQKEDRELTSIQKTELIHSSFDFLAAPENLTAFSRVSDLMTALSPPNDPNERLYRMLRACILATNSSQCDLKGLIFYFEYWLLRLSGYMPDWRYCYNCNKQFASNEIAELDGTFNLRCGRCIDQPGIFSFDNRSFDLLQGVEKLSPTDFINKYSSEPHAISYLSPVFERMLSAAVGKTVTLSAGRAI